MSRPLQIVDPILPTYDSTSADSAVSSEAGAVADQRRGVLIRLWNSQALFGPEADAPSAAANEDEREERGALGAQLRQKFAELHELNDGWYGGEGVAPAPDALDMVCKNLEVFHPSEFPLPAVVPTPEGDLLLEWRLASHPSLDIRLGDMYASFHAFERDGADVEREYDLSSPEQWREMFLLLVKTDSRG